MAVGKVPTFFHFLLILLESSIGPTRREQLSSHLPGQTFGMSGGVAVGRSQAVDWYCSNF